jgi:hypothetical protein
LLGYSQVEVAVMTVDNSQAVSLGQKRILKRTSSTFPGQTTSASAEMAEALKDEGNKLMNDNKPLEAIAKYETTVIFACFTFSLSFARLSDSHFV